MKFSEILNYLMSQNGFTVNHLADKLQISHKTVQNWLDNKSEPRLTTLTQLTEIFHVSYNDLLGYNAKTDEISKTLKLCKMNVVNRHNVSRPECTHCGHRFETDYASNPYKEMCRIAKGKYQYCPICGAKYTGCQIDGIDYEQAPVELQDWIDRGVV